MSEKFKMPETREEALERKEVLLEQINKYNEEYFTGTTTLTEEEINLIQEEYQYLDELLEGEENEKEVVEETDKKFLDKVNIGIWIFAMFNLFFANFFIQEAVGMNIVFSISGAEWVLNLDDAGINFLIISCFLIYPLVLIIIGLIIKLFAFKKSVESKKTFKFVFYGQLVWLLLNFVPVFIIYIYPSLK